MTQDFPLRKQEKLPTEGYFTDHEEQKDYSYMLATDTNTEKQITSSEPHTITNKVEWPEPNDYFPYEHEDGSERDPDYTNFANIEEMLETHRQAEYETWRKQREKQEQEQQQTTTVPPFDDPMSPEMAAVQAILEAQRIHAANQSFYENGLPLDEMPFVDDEDPYPFAMDDEEDKKTKHKSSL